MARSQEEVYAGLGALLETNPEDHDGEPEDVIERPARTQRVEALDEDADDDLDEGEDADEGDDEASSEEPFKVLVVDGKEYPVESEDDYQALAQKGLHYTYKSQELSRVQSEFEQQKAEAEQRLSQQLQEYTTALPQLIALLEQPLGQEPNWLELAQTDPAKHAVLREQWNQQTAKRDAAKAELAAAQAEQQRIANDAFGRWVADQDTKLKEHVPGWTDTTEPEAVQHLISEGFSAQELQNPLFRDFRVRKLLLDAMNYNRVSTNGKREVVKAGQTIEPHKGKKQPTKRSRAYREKRQAARKTGDVRAVGDVMAGLFND